MASVQMPRKRINDGSLPQICIVCGENATHVGFPGVGAPSLAWLLVSPLIGLLGFWGYIAFGGGRNRHDQPAGFPFCDRHRKYWPRRARFIIGGFLVLVVLMGVGFALTPGAFGANKPEPHWLLGVAGAWMIIYLPTFMVVHLMAVRPTVSAPKSVTFSLVSNKFAAALKADRSRPEL